jgi:RNA polymerase sigma factor (sigma-70 family)
MSESGVTKSSALSTLLENHRLFLAFLERRVGTKADAEDILQTAFVKMIENPASLRNEERVVAWFYRDFRNALSDHYRWRDAKQRAHQMAAHAAQVFGALELDPELTLSRRWLPESLSAHAPRSRSEEPDSRTVVRSLIPLLGLALVAPIRTRHV